MQNLTSQQRTHFDTFGYLVLRGAIRDEIDVVADEFEATFADLGVAHDGARRSIVVPFVDQRPRLSALLEHDVIAGALTSILGPDFNYLGSDGNRYSGDTAWHSDGFHPVGLFLKVAVYLDPVDRDSGALRVIPASHHQVDLPQREAYRSDELWGIPMVDVPCVSLDSEPGDVVVFNHNLMHASFGGSTSRRMFTLNCSARATSPEEISDLETYIGGHGQFWLHRVHARTMREDSPPERMVHLAQPMEHDGHLATLASAARAAGGEPPVYGWETTT